ncbi:MAG: hypothetical protein ACKOB4_03735 [Acidobacteriota bacterium]
MEDENVKEESPAELVWGIESAELAYGVIARYVDHAQISGMVIALLASALGEERVKPLTQSEYWQAYMAGRRSLQDAREEIDQLTQLIERMRGRQS